MFAENDHYGHARILRAFAGVHDRSVLVGRLQHGWVPGSGVRPVDRAEPIPKLVWSRRNLEACRRDRVVRAVPIGAPFVYMPAPEPIEPEGDTVLVMPFHGWEKEPLAGGMADYAKSLEELRARGMGPFTVCLYWHEFEQPAHRAAFERLGHATFSAGHRSDPQFLDRLRRAILRHAYVSSNRISTSAFYALALGRPFFLHGPEMSLGTAAPDASAARSLREEFSELTLDRFDGRARHEIGKRELGFEFRRTRAELREILAWRRRDVARRALRRARFHAWRAAKAVSG